MKELSIEEKAKRYDEVIERAKSVLLDCTSEEQKVVEYITPEIKESEDERIRKVLLDYFKDYKTQEEISKSLSTFFGIPTNDIIVWLEKQAKHANFINKIQVGDKVTRNEDGVLVNLSQLNRVAKHTEEYNITGIGSKHAEGKLAEKIKELKPLNEILEKQGEQKTLCDKCRKEHPSHSCQDITEIGRCAVEHAQKPAWGEEDENRLSDAIFFVREYQIPTRDKMLLNAAKKAEDWLKSLKERYAWKPSIAQLTALSIVSKGNATDDIEAIVSLYNDLKKLREE